MFGGSNHQSTCRGGKKEEGKRNQTQGANNGGVEIQKKKKKSQQHQKEQTLERKKDQPCPIDRSNGGKGGTRNPTRGITKRQTNGPSEKRPKKKMKEK